MKTHILLASLLCFTFVCVQAQFVNIPDTNFRNFLMQDKFYRNCLNNSKQLDTTCSYIVNETKLLVTSTSIRNLDGVRYFDNLTTLNCPYNELTSLPILPKGVKVLNFSGNKFSVLPSLPSGIITLSCGQNQLTSLPTLPSGLTTLNCGQNQLTSLPTLPSGLTTLNCDDNQLASLPSLPSGLTTIYCNNNQLTNLPVMPTGLLYLISASNKLSALPTLPNGLLTLDFSKNKITSINSLPSGLTSLSCTDNLLTNLPLLPINLSSLYCSGNLFTCFPFLPSGLIALEFDTSKIKCLPQRVSLLGNTLINKYPVCNPTNNPNQCEAFPTLRGHLFLDVNKDAVQSIDEVSIPNINIRSTGKINRYTTSNAEGNFRLAVDTLGSFIFTPDLIKNFSWVPTSKTISFTVYGQEENQDFGLQAIASVEDMGMKLTALNIARPGSPLYFELTSTNVGTVNATVLQSFHFPAEFSIESITGGGTETSTGTISWPSSNLESFQQNKLRVYGRLSSSTPLGSTLKFYSNINPNSATDVDMSDNLDSTLMVVRGSFDPNDKSATPFISPSSVANGSPIDYTVRFQNTGTDTAFTVVVRDTLSVNLQSKPRTHIPSSFVAR